MQPGLKSIFLNIAIICIAVVCAQGQANVEFDQTNFPNNKAELKEALQNLKSGDKLVQKGNLSEALAMYLSANTLNPNNALLNYKIGKCYTQIRQKRKATPYLEKARDMNLRPADDLFLLLGSAYQSGYRFDDAIRCYEEYSAAKPTAKSEMKKLVAQCELGKQLIQNPTPAIVENLKEVNTISADYAPVINAGETMMMFTSNRRGALGEQIDPMTGELFASDDDIYVTFNINGLWQMPVNMGKPVNTIENDAAIGLSADGKHLFVFKGVNGGDIYETYYENSMWTEPTYLSLTVNSTAQETKASLSPDGNTLYFVSNRSGGVGGSDIYMSPKQDKGWGKAVNLGAKINTPGDEVGVFMHPDGKTLFFSSNGHPTIGGYDVFRSTLQEDGSWSEPENLGFPINTPEDDVFFVLSQNGLHGYYSSEREEGLGSTDIYKVTFINPLVSAVPMSNQTTTTSSAAAPAATAVAAPMVLRGMVVNDSGIPVNSMVTLRNNQNGEVVTRFETTVKNGTFRVFVPTNVSYKLAVEADGYNAHYENLDVEAQQKELLKNITLQVSTDNIAAAAGMVKASEPVAAKVDPAAELVKEDLRRELEAQVRAELMAEMEAVVKAKQDSVLREIEKAKEATLAAEAARMQAENERMVAEKNRAAAEQERATAERNRIAAENERAAAEKNAAAAVVVAQAATPVVEQQAAKPTAATPVSEKTSKQEVTQEPIKVESAPKAQAAPTPVIEKKVEEEKKTEPKASAKSEPKPAPSNSFMQANDYTLFFTTNNYRFDSEQLPRELDVVLWRAKSDTTLKLDIVGHIDNTRNESMTKQLAQRRADLAYTYLLENGLQSERMTSRAVGATQPLVERIKGDTAYLDGKLNRRVSIYFYKENLDTAHTPSVMAIDEYNVFFRVNNSRLYAEQALGTIAAVAYRMKQNSALNLEIKGHADNEGPEEANMNLSRWRARKVYSELVSLGVDPSRITYSPVSSNEPLVDETTPESKVLNRRVSMRLY